VSQLSVGVTINLPWAGHVYGGTAMSTMHGQRPGLLHERRRRRQRRNEQLCSRALDITRRPPTMIKGRARQMPLIIWENRRRHECDLLPQTSDAKRCSSVT